MSSKIMWSERQFFLYYNHIHVHEYLFGMQMKTLLKILLATK